MFANYLEDNLRLGY